MAQTSKNEQKTCYTCKKIKVAYPCNGCSKQYCIKDLNEHLRILSIELGDIEKDRSQLYKLLLAQRNDPQTLPMMIKVDEWERDAIAKIKRTAEECRQLVMENINDHFIEVEKKLLEMGDQLHYMSQGLDFNEIHLQQLRTRLAQLTEELVQPKNLSIQQEAAVSAWISKLSVSVSSTRSQKAVASLVPRWSHFGTTVAGGEGQGNGAHQLYYPYGLCIDEDLTLVIADYGNHRVVQWKKDHAHGQVVGGGNGQGSRLDQLNGPTDVVVDKETNSYIICDYGNRRVVRWSRHSGTIQGEILVNNIDCHGLFIDEQRNIYVSDVEKHEIRRYRLGEKNGALIAGGNGKGSGLNQLNSPSYMFVDQNQNLYVSDNGNHRVMKWNKGAREGILVAGGQGQGGSLSQLSHPNGLFVDPLGFIYIADFGNQRVLRWSPGSKHGSIFVGVNAQGAIPSQSSGPIGICSDNQGFLYVADYDNHRIQRYAMA